MRILHLSYSDELGGASKAAYRLHRGMRREGVDSNMLVRIKKTEDPYVKQFDTGARWIRRRYRQYLQRKILRDRERFPTDSSETGQKYLHDDRTPWRSEITSELGGYDCIVLHWINTLVDFNSLFHFVSRNKLLLVWRLADMSVFTGGCSYAWGCRRYKDGCGNCPQLLESGSSDYSRQIVKRKKKAFDQLDSSQLQVVTLNRWMLDHVKKSPLLNRFLHQVIPNGVDTDTFYKRSRKSARAHLDLDPDRLYVLTIAQDVNDKRKGTHCLTEAVKGLGQEVTLISVGRGSLPSLPLDTIEWGSVSKPEELAEIYSVADLLVVTSLEDNQPNTVLESMACGTPVLAFKAGGIPEMFVHGEHGWLIERGNIQRLREKMSELLADKNRLHEAGERAAAWVYTHFSREKQVHAYLQCLDSLLQANTSPENLPQSSCTSS